MSNNTKRLRNTMIITLIASTVAISSGGVVFAWFISQKDAAIDVMNLSVGTDTTKAELKYCSLNKFEGKFVGYKGNDSRIVSDSYDNYFLEADEESRKALVYAPGYSFTFSVEVTGGISSNKLILSKYTSLASDSKYRKLGGTDKYFALAEALDVYTVAYDHKPTATELVDYFNAQGVVGQDRFTYTTGTTAEGTSTNSDLSATFDGSSAFVLMTLYFSDAPSTWYSLAKTSTSKHIAYDGTNLSYEIDHPVSELESFYVKDTVTSDGLKAINLSGFPLEVTGLTINGVDKSSEIPTRVASSGKEKTIYLDPAASNNDTVEVTYKPYSNMYSFNDTSIELKETPLPGAVMDFTYKYLDEYYVADPTRGSSNVFENLSILLNEIKIG